MIKSIIPVTDYDNLVMVDCEIKPRIIKCNDFDYPVGEVKDKTTIIYKILLPYKNFNGMVHIPDVYLIDAIHPNAVYVNDRIYPKIQNNHSLYKYCINTITMDSYDDMHQKIEILADNLSWWDFQNCYWKDYTKISINVPIGNSIYHKIKGKMVDSRKMHKLWKIRQIIANTKGIGKLFGMSADDFEESSMKILNFVF